MNRGDVYLVSLVLPNRGGGGGTSTKDKLIIVLNDGRVIGTAREVAVLIGSSWNGNPLRPFEVLVGTADGFHHDTVIDCRWPYTLPQSQLPPGRHVLTLPQAVMTRISVGVVRGLQ